MSFSEHVWQHVKVDPEVVAAQAALDAHEAEEERLLLELGRALRRAQKRVEGGVDGSQPG